MKVQTKKETMTNKERVEALLRREKPDRVPFWPFILPNFSMVYSGGSVLDAYTCEAEVTYELEKKACQDFDMVFTPSFNARHARRGAAAAGAATLPTAQNTAKAVFERNPTKTADEVMALKTDDVRRFVYPPEVMPFVKQTCREELDNKPFITVGGLGVVNTAAGITGYYNLCKWMIQKPEVAHHALRLATDYLVDAAQYYKDIFGVEGVMPAGANGAASMLSPKHFEQFALPYLKEVHQKILAMGFKHLHIHPCGEQNRHLPYWQQLSLGDPGIFWVGDEIDLATAAKYFPNDIIAGNLNSVIIQVGTPDEVYEAAKKVIEQGKRLPTGFIFRQACELPPRAPVANIMAMVRAVNDFGWY